MLYNNKIDVFDSIWWVQVVWDASKVTRGGKLDYMSTYGYIYALLAYICQPTSIAILPIMFYNNKIAVFDSIWWAQGGL
jgi:hypothetical protein